MIKAGIIGSIGYAGGELVRLLLQRNDTKIKWYGSRSYIDQRYTSIYCSMFRIMDDACMDNNMKELANQVDVVLTATPQGLRAPLMDEDMSPKVKIISLGADFRIKDVSVYEKQYKLTHVSPRFIGKVAYGLPEIDRGKAKKARFIANPGYFPTCSFLSTYPLVKRGPINPNTIIIDTRSGTSGVGRGSKVDSLYCEVNGNIEAYGVASHRHTSEAEEQLSRMAGKPTTISFTSHLVPMNREILVTVCVFPTKKIFYKEVKTVHDKYHRNEYPVRVLEKDAVPQTRWVKDSSFAGMNFKIDTRTNRMVMMGAIGNTIKGAAGQATQSMNLMSGLLEDTGLKQTFTFP